MEERKYSRQKWVTIDSPVQKGERDQKFGDMFRALFGYITGKNEKCPYNIMTYIAVNPDMRTKSTHQSLPRIMMMI